MFELLSRYLLGYKKMIIPKVGSFEVEAINAHTDFGKETLAPPSWKLNFKSISDKEMEQPGKDFYDWLGANKNITPKEAEFFFTKFANELDATLATGAVVEWSGIGTLQKIGKSVQFTTSNSFSSPFTTVTAKKIVREKPNYTAIVGNEEIPVSQGQIDKPIVDENNRSRLLIWILVIGVLLALAWYFLVKMGR